MAQTKMTYALLMVFIVELSIFFFGGSTYGQTTLFGFLLNPSTILASTFWLAIVSALTLIGLSVILPGNFIQINIYALYAGVAAIFITFTHSLVNSYGWFKIELLRLLKETPCAISTNSQFGCTPITTLILAVVFTPIIVFYFMAILEWVRSNQ